MIVKECSGMHTCAHNTDIQIFTICILFVNYSRINIYLGNHVEKFRTLWLFYKIESRNLVIIKTIV